jgi:hypothetical protein
MKEMLRYGFKAHNFLVALVSKKKNKLIARAFSFISQRIFTYPVKNCGPGHLRRCLGTKFKHKWLP